MTIRTVKKDGTANYTTITAAVAAANADDIIEIQDTEAYSESQFQIFYERLTFRSANFMSGILDDLPSLDGTAISGSPILCYASGCKYMGLEICNWGSPTGGDLIRGGNIAAKNRVLSGCYIHDNNSHGISAIQGVAGNYSVIQDCRIINNAGRGANIGDWVLFNNCLFSSTAVDQDGIMGNSNYNVTASFCTVNFNSANGSGSPATWGIGMTYGKVINCIVTGTNNGLSFTSCAAIGSSDASNNCVHLDCSSPYQDSAASPRSPFATEIIADPLFVDPSIYDYTLQADSPCVDTGAEYSTALGLVITDLDDNVRPQNALFDMGAFERGYVAPPIVIPRATLQRRRAGLSHRYSNAGTYARIYPVHRRN
jgi:hypothetical protein